MQTEELFRADSYLKQCSATVVAADAGGIALDRTVFYAMGGGQPGDTGRLVLADGTALTVTDTVKGADGGLRHLLAEGSTLPVPGTAVTAEIDWERRYRHMRMHSCLHLLCSLVDGNVTGGQIGDARSRLDFDVPGATLDKAALTEGLNRLIGADHPVSVMLIADDELARRPELVRTMSVKPPTGSGTVRLMQIGDIDLQACGGTHVGRTGEIGPVEVIKIENKGKQNRRVIVALLAP